MLVLVVVAFVFGVLVAVVDIVHVVAVLDLFVRAVRSAVLVLGRGVFRRVIVFVVVAFVFSVPVAVMDEVHMVAVPDRYVRAVGTAVPVLGECMFGLDFLGHDVLLRQAQGRSRRLAFLSVCDGVLDDTGHVIIGQGVDGFAPGPGRRDQIDPLSSRKCWETRGAGTASLLQPVRLWTRARGQARTG
jgi:hypothetical protein